MVKFLKEFLKPDWWKVGIVIVMVFLYFTVKIGIEDVVVGQAPEVIIGGEVVTYTPITEQYFNPIIWPFANVFRDFSYKYQIIGYLYWILLLIYWYLLACLIYFIIVKIKKKSVAHK